MLSAIVNLSAIKKNYAAVSSLVGSGVAVSAVVKSNAYGLGAVQVSRALYDVGCRHFWTAYLVEALDVRDVLPDDAKVYYLQGFRADDLPTLRASKVVPVINSVVELPHILGQGLPFALHVDSGLSRLGIRPEALDNILPLLENECVECVISHLACSDDATHPLNQMQKASFDASLKKVRRVVSTKGSLSASAGILLGSGFHYDMVRAGAFLYGIRPDVQVNVPVPLENVLTLTAPVLQKYTLEPDVSIGYGATYTTSRLTKVAIVSVGYADGLKRTLSNRGHIGFYDCTGHFHKAPIVGKISMDLVACDVSDIPDDATSVGIQAIILDGNYTIDDMSVDAATIPCDVLTGINFGSRRFSISYVN